MSKDKPDKSAPRPLSRGGINGGWKKHKPARVHGPGGKYVRRKKGA